MGLGATNFDGEPVSLQCPKKPPTKKVTIRASMFFDGTGNNRSNTILGPAGAPSIERLGTSYRNGFSNIALLEWYVLDNKQADHFIRIYTEGVGTTSTGRDDVVSAGTGMGLAGIEAKVEAALGELVDAITLKVPDPEQVQIVWIKIDVFGFSRGAATARYFIWKCLDNKKVSSRLAGRLKRRGYRVEDGDIKFIFVGLFDTVVSAGLPGMHESVAKEYHMDAIKKAERVVQLASAEEHRENFSLSEIQSAMGSANGLQIFLPGAHSDVGGGYNEGDSESNAGVFVIHQTPVLGSIEQAILQKEIKWFIDGGWYKEGTGWESPEIKTRITNQPTEFSNLQSGTLLVDRRNISNSYQFIPMRIMADFCKKKGLKISKALEARHPIPPALQVAHAAIKAYVAKMGETGEKSKLSDWFGHPIHPASPPLPIAELRKLRHDYLHISSYVDVLGMSPGWSSRDQATRHRKRALFKG